VQQVILSKTHGAFNVVNGLWPLLHRRSFEAVFGPKVDRWLMFTVAGLLVTNGVVQVTADGSRHGQRLAKRVGLGTAATLGLIDLIYAPGGRISRSYLADAAMEMVWVCAWLRAVAPEDSESPGRAGPSRGQVSPMVAPSGD